MPNRAAELHQRVVADRPGAILVERGPRHMKHQVGIGSSPTEHFLWSGSLGALHFQNHAGDWVEIDNDLIPDSGQYVRKTKQTPYLMRVASSGRRRIYPDPEDLTCYIQVGGMAAIGPPSYVGNSMRWENARGFDFELIPRGSGVKMNITIHRPGAPHSFTFTMQLVGLTRWGRFIFKDEKPVMEIVQPTAWDSSEESREAELEFVGNAVRITVDPEGLQYPITLDPTFDLGEGGDDVSAWAGPYFNATNAFGNIGRALNNPYNTGHRFQNVTVAKDATIVSAYIQLTARTTRTTTPCNLKVAAEDADDPAQITDRAAWDARSRTAYVNWNGVPPWSADEKGPDTKSPDLSTPIGTVTSRPGWASDGSIIIFVEENNSTNGRYRQAHMYESGDGSDAADLYIEYAEDFITGEAALAAEGTLTPKGILSPGLLKSSLSGDGTLACIGSVGALRLGAADLSADGAFTAKAILAPMLARANLDAGGALTAVAVRTRTALAALAAEGALAARGEIGNVLEAVISLSASGTLTAEAIRTRTATAALAAEGVMVAGAVLAPGLMKAALSAEGTLKVISDVGPEITMPMTKTTRKIDPAHYPAGTIFELVVSLEASAPGIWIAYLYNTTLDKFIVESIVTSSAQGTTRVVSSPITLDNGPNVYRVHYGGTEGITYIPHGAALRVHI